MKTDWDLILDHKRIIDTGGSSYIIESEINYNFGELKKGEKVILKHCIAFMTKAGCDLFSLEANYLNKIKKNLVEKKICNNFPIYFDYYLGCLFNELEKLKEIFQIDNEINDELFYFSNLEILDIDFYLELRNKYTIDYLESIKSKLKIKNFNIINSLFPYKNLVFGQKNIYEFLEEEYNIGCSPNIIMSKILGTNLNKMNNFKISDGMLFDLIYSNICLALYFGEIFADDNLSNIMIEDEPKNRIYKINDEYYFFKDQRLLLIDVQVTNKFINIHQLYGKIWGRITSSQKDFLNMFSKYFDIISIIKELFPLYFKQNIISKNFAKELICFDKELNYSELNLNI